MKKPEITLEVIQTTANGSVHAKLFINNEDVGVLYLSPDEKSNLEQIINLGLVNWTSTPED